MADIKAEFLDTKVKGTLNVDGNISTNTLTLNGKNVLFNPDDEAQTLISDDGKKNQLITVAQAVDIITNKGNDASPSITFTQGDGGSEAEAPTSGNITLSEKDSDNASGIFIRPLLAVLSGYGNFNSEVVKKYNKANTEDDKRKKAFYITHFGVSADKTLSGTNSGTLNLTSNNDSNDSNSGTLNVTNIGLINIGANSSNTVGTINFGNTSKQKIKSSGSPTIYVDAKNCSTNTKFEIVTAWDNDNVSKEFTVTPKNSEVSIESGNTLQILNLNGGTITDLKMNSSGGSINTITASDGTLQITKLTGRMDLINVGDSNNTSKLNVDFLYGLMKITGVKPNSSVGITALSGSAFIDGGNGTINIKDNAFTGTINLYKEDQSSSQILPVTITNNDVSMKIGSSMVRITDGTNKNSITKAAPDLNYYTTNNTTYGTLQANSGWIDTTYSIKAAAVGTTVVDGSGAVFKPVLTTVSTQSGGTERNINNISGAIGSSTPNKPDSGFYYAVKSASDNDKTISFSPRISTAGWIQNGVISSAEASGTISLTNSDTLYVPVTSGSVTLGGGTNASHTITGGTVTAPQNFTCSSSVEPDFHWAPVIETTGNPSGIPIDIYSSAQYSDISVSAISATSTYNPVSIAKTIGFITGGTSSYSIPSSTANKAASTISGRSISNNKTIWLTGFTIPASSSFNISSIANTGVLNIDDVVSGGEVRIDSVSGGTVYIGDVKDTSSVNIENILGGSVNINNPDTVKTGEINIAGRLGDKDYVGVNGNESLKLYVVGYFNKFMGKIDPLEFRDSSLSLRSGNNSGELVVDDFFSAYISPNGGTIHMTNIGASVAITTDSDDTDGYLCVENGYVNSDHIYVNNTGNMTLENSGTVKLKDGTNTWTMTNSSGTIVFE